MPDPEFLSDRPLSAIATGIGDRARRTLPREAATRAPHGASLTLEGGGSMKDVATRLGHTSARMADELYTRLFDGRRHEIADRLGDLREVVAPECLIGSE